MGTLNIFQTYSQKENHTTNNVLLLFSRIYSNDPKLYNQIINSLLNQESLYDIVPNFRQQDGDGIGIADGHISLKSSAIVIETKLDNLEQIDKLVGYCDRLKGADTKILLHLSKQVYGKDDVTAITQRVKKEDIHFASITYQHIIDSLHQIRLENSYNRELVLLDDDFRDYCDQFNLVSDQEYIMRALACGQSYDLNEQYAFYFDLASRGYRPHSYVGVYNNKAVIGIGKIEAIVTADLVDDKLEIHKTEGNASDEILNRLKSAIQGTTEAGWNISRDHTFFLFDRYYKTNFVKTSKYGLQRAKYFDLREVLDIKELPDTSQIAQLLDGKSWEDQD